MSRIIKQIKSRLCNGCTSERYMLHELKIISI